MENIYGIVDIGTLKVKTEIASVGNDGVLKKVASSNNLTCFGVGIDENNGLAQKKYVEQTIDELLRVKAEFAKYGVNKFRVVSTHAMRRAANREEIIERVKREVGFDIENISQEQEAELFFMAVMKTFIPSDQKYAVIDVGGGSVQILLGTKEKLEHTLMMKTGTVSLHEKFVIDPHNPNSITTLENMEQMKNEILNGLMDIPKYENIPLVYGSSMIIDIMQKLKIKLDSHEDSLMHPYKTYAKHLLEVIDTLIPLKFQEREDTFSLPQKYAWGLDGAFLNVVTTAEHFSSPYIIPSNANIAQGIMYTMVEK